MAPNDRDVPVLVVGAGPSGLSAAYHLRRLGHGVKIVEAGPFAGGMMRFGIPTYRLPRVVLDGEITRILDLGVELEFNRKVTDVRATMQAEGFGAAFLAVGAQIARRAYIPAGDAARILDAISVLRGMKGDDKPMLGRRVVVNGGGNKALDGARTAKPVSPSESIIVYRRTREKMRAHDFDIEETLPEGVLVRWLSTIRIIADAGALNLEKMALDDRGIPQPTGEFEALEADSLVLAMGRDADLSLLENVPDLAVRDGVVQVGPNMMTGFPGLFAGGDIVPSAPTVPIAVGRPGTLRAIETALKGDRLVFTVAQRENVDEPAPERLRQWLELQLDYLTAPEHQAMTDAVAESASLSDEVRADIGQGHRELYTTLASILSDVAHDHRAEGGEEPHLRGVTVRVDTMLVAGSLRSAAELVLGGVDRAIVLDRLVRLALALALTER